MIALTYSSPSLTGLVSSNLRLVLPLKHAASSKSLIIAFCATLSAKELRVLAIGNSFSICVGKFLPPMVASVPGHRIQLTSAYIGSCSLERHWNSVLKAEKNAKSKPYVITVWDSAHKGFLVSKYRGNVNELVKKNKYDIITIQQNSNNSFKYETYQPFAKNLIAYLKKHQPQAEIVIQQTWSYRSDSTLLKQLGIDNSTMYDKLAEAYSRLAKENGFRIIPSGYAVQIFREKTPVKYVPLTEEELKKFKKPATPAWDADVVGIHKWGKKKGENKGLHLMADWVHLNPHGEYLQAAVWFNTLFDQPATSVKYIPRGMKAARAKFLLECAAEAVANYKQPGK